MFRVWFYFSSLFYLLYLHSFPTRRSSDLIDAETHQTYEFTSNIVFLNASAFNSTWILMNSATDIWPDGLGSGSGELGHNVMDHHFRLGAGGRVEGYLDKRSEERRVGEEGGSRWTPTAE